MISKDGTGFWATGITVHYSEGRGWGGAVEYYDDGFVDDAADTGRIATQGELRTRYFVKDGETVTGLSAVVDVLLADAERLGIRFRAVAADAPSLYYKGDGEWQDYPAPDGWKALLEAEAQRIGWAR